MNEISETCSCGATYRGPTVRAGEWRRDHRHEFPPPAPAIEGEERTDSTGYTTHAGSTDRFLGFTIPALDGGDE